MLRITALGIIALLCATGLTAQQELWNVDLLGSEAPPFEAIGSGVAVGAVWSESLQNQPLPTNRWWQNMALGDGSSTCNVLPYLVQAHGAGLRACLPGRVTTADFVLSPFVANWSIGALGLTAANTYQITAFDDLSITLEWPGLTMPLVRGMSGLTAEYDSATPAFTTIHALLTVNGSAPGTHTADRFEISLNNGSTWVLHTSSPITLQATPNGLEATTPWTGTARLTVLSTNDGLVSIDPDIVDAHIDNYPVGGAVSATATDDSGQITFTWATASMSGSTPGAPLMYALPHHQQILTEPTLPACAITTIKGTMEAVAATSWHMTEPLTPIGYEAAQPIPEALRPHIAAALAEDADFPVTAGDTYFGGKQLAALGRLALIADELGEATTAANIRSNLAAALTPWLAGTNGDPLRYDTDWGGVVSSSGGSFGQGLYNDHHFHYGYFLYAAAALAKEDPAWLAEWGDEVNQLARNVANPWAGDPHYTQARNKDWFVGHSWASGLYTFGDGRNQESSSEAVNAWYGAHLWGLASAQTHFSNLARLLLATEIRSTHLYWQVDSGDGIYPEPYASRKVVGVLWSTKVDHGTFFGGNLEFIHGIQMLPFTPITEELLDPNWVSEAYPVVAQALDSPDIGDGWKGFIHSTHAVIDPVSAWDEVLTLSGHDDGNTLTNTLYWIATRPGAESINPDNPPPADSGVTFSVDMAGETLLNGNVYITGGTLDDWCGTCTPLADIDGDGIFAVTLDLPPGPFEYKFINGDWSAAEMFDPSTDAACTLTTGEFSNRYFVVPADGNADLPVVCFNSCEACDPLADCPSDTNGNGICDTDDIPGCTYSAAANFDPVATMDNGSCVYDAGPLCPGDLNSDGVVSVTDLLALLGVFGEDCP